MSTKIGESCEAGRVVEDDDGTTKEITFVFGKTSLAIEEPPWLSRSNDSTTPPASDVPQAVTIPPFVNERSVEYMVTTHGLPNTDACAAAHLTSWGVVKMARSSQDLEASLFTSSGSGASFSLVPQPRSSVPLQWSHHGPGAIPSDLADRPCDTLDVAAALQLLNDVLGTAYSLESSGLHTCLEHVLHTSRDFGEVYGRFRPHWKSDFAALLSTISQRKLEYERQHRNSLSGGQFLWDARIYPRRIWDLYSNRVLPIYALEPCALVNILPRNFCTVSHSWVRGEDRKPVTTPINGREWPVPIPRDTTLEHVRVELLNSGFEYTWLDVLCLRQQGLPEGEAQRKEEWKIDVPTLGCVYGEYQPCVTYFNGLGLPFDPSPVLRSSDRHWLNRVWTLQEGTDQWLHGGATGSASAAAKDFFPAHALPALRHRITKHSTLWAEAMRTRHCTKELDKVQGLAYIFGCSTMPVYDEDIAPDAAWETLLEHVPDSVRRDLAARHVQHCPDEATLLPSWAQFLRWTLVADTPGDWGIDIVDTDRRGTPEPVVYYHLLVGYWGPFLIVQHGQVEGGGSDALIELRAPDGSHEPYRITGRLGGALSEGTPYILIDVHADAGVWIVAEVRREREQFITGYPALDIVKRGGLVASRNLQEQLPNGRKTVSAVYGCDDPEAQAAL
ncbi:hypothetical protein PsYK624_171640 [Phanerochaete sordida]|uniref:Heterokaryon incompatibility domain-containing protein n=1 Tax=Phanerochaete sordida TaxID=48140 RepID=A0A9P3GTI9_9APHY|nr:hypothetical protein PsYK624_171640 [Phanerochaete sordida]